MPESSRAGTITMAVQHLVDRLAKGGSEARNELITVASERLRLRARSMMRSFVHNLPAGADADEVVSEAVIRLCKALENIRPTTAREFFGLCSKHMRWVLLEWIRRPQKFEGLTGRDPAQGSTVDPARLAAWTEFHEQVEKLPEEERETFELLYYQNLTHQDAAETLGVSEATVKRRWSRARRRLYELLGGDSQAVIGGT